MLSSTLLDEGGFEDYAWSQTGIEPAAQEQLRRTAAAPGVVVVGALVDALAGADNRLREQWTARRAARGDARVQDPSATGPAPPPGAVAMHRGEGSRRPLSSR